jgi:hypothetical protein
MISVGGFVVYDNEYYDNDPWRNGIGVFDLSALEWKESYDPAAASYVTPDVVKSQIETNGRYPDTWSDSTVEGWFTQKSKVIASVRVEDY